MAPPSQGRGKLPCREVHVQRPLPRTPYKRTKERHRDQVGRRRKNGRKVTHREAAEHPCSGTASHPESSLFATGKGAAARDLTLTRDSLPRNSGGSRPLSRVLRKLSVLSAVWEASGSGAARASSRTGRTNGATLSSDFQEQVAGLPPGSRAARIPETPTAFWKISGEPGFRAPLPPHFLGRCHRIPYTLAQLTLKTGGRRQERKG